MEFLASCGTQIAFLGATLAVALACAGSGVGCGSVGEAGTGVLSEDPSKFASVLIMQILPGTQGLYGLVIWFFALMKMGFFSGSIVTLTAAQGFGYFAACLPMGIGGLVTAIAQGRCAATGVMLMAKRPEEMAKGIVIALIIEFYAVLCLLASFLMLNSF
ncbi:MAG: V-type ATP synthase subunit K [Oscillospiraceae bacterium]|jgi:V/A-type H+-transporting ATPase subunit K|nr:V-type ATP synthase subunit K [Oscillospiraceae bacterium]